MAVYNLARGGYAPEYGTSCNSCSCDIDENGLPLWLQPDLRSNGGYGLRDKVEWKQLMTQLDIRYGKDAGDLAVGDQLLIFLQPNHANVQSLFVDFFEPLAGFKFKLTALNGADYSGTSKKITYTDRYEVDSVADEDVNPATVDPRTQWVTLVEDGYNAKVDAVVLEIESLPSGGLVNDIKMLFGRRFEQDGYMMPARAF